MSRSHAEEKVDSVCTRVVQYSYKWAVKNFSSIVDNSGRQCRSPVFSAKPDDGLKWRVIVYPKGYEVATNKFSICYLSLESCKFPAVSIKYRIYYVDPHWRNLKEEKSFAVFNHERTYPYAGTRMMTSRESLIERGYLSDDTMRIVCEITTSSASFHMPHCQLADDLERLFDVQECSDVVIDVRGRNFSAHKAILAARSTVFSAMFNHDMREQAENHVEITDIDGEVFEEMLRFVYTGRVINLRKYADRLLVAADKYALERLKLLCEETLYTCLEINNAADVLMLADRHNAQQLKIRTTKYITKNLRHVFRTVGFNVLVTSHSHLMLETLGVLYEDEDKGKNKNKKQEEEEESPSESPSESESDSESESE